MSKRSLKKTKKRAKSTDSRKGEQKPSDKQLAKEALSQAAAALGRLGGLKGGRARAEKLTAEERSAIARKAAVLRWERQKRNQ